MSFSRSTLLGEDGMSVGSSWIVMISSAVKVTVVDELDGQVLYRLLPSAMVYCLSMMAIVGELSIVALTMPPTTRSDEVVAHLVKGASTNCLFVFAPLSGVWTGR